MISAHCEPLANAMRGAVPRKKNGLPSLRHPRSFTQPAASSSGRRDVPPVSGESPRASDISRKGKEKAEIQVGDVRGKPTQDYIDGADLVQKHGCVAMLLVFSFFPHRSTTNCSRDRPFPSRPGHCWRSRKTISGITTCPQKAPPSFLRSPSTCLG